MVVFRVGRGQDQLNGSVVLLRGGAVPVLVVGHSRIGQVVLAPVVHPPTGYRIVVVEALVLPAPTAGGHPPLPVVAVLVVEEVLRWPGSSLSQ